MMRILTIEIWDYRNSKRTEIRGKRCEKATGDFRSQMRGISVNDDDSDDDYGDILSREMKSCA